MIGLVDGNNFYVSCERVLNPKLVGKLVAVLSNMVFFGLEKAGTARQLDLFTQTKAHEQSKLYEVIDRMNKQYGKGSVGSASEGLRYRKPLWHMKRDKLSKVSTTDWAKLPHVR